MSTSKFPHGIAKVSPALIAYAAVCPGLVCNLRPHQRVAVPSDHVLLGSDAVWVDEPVRVLLKSLVLPAKVLLHFQGYGVGDIGTAVVTITSIYWTDDGYPRLDFVRPPEFHGVYGCPNFWGAFILAIVPVPPETTEFARRDGTARRFIALARELVQLPAAMPVI